MTKLPADKVTMMKSQNDEVTGSPQAPTSTWSNG